MLQCQSLSYFYLLLQEMVSSKYYVYVIQGFRTIAPEENGLPPNLNSNANPKPNPNSNRGAIFLGRNCPDTIYQVSTKKTISNWYDIRKAVEKHCKPVEMVSTWQHFLLKRLFKHTIYLYQFCLKFVFKVVQTLKKDICY